MRFQPPDGQQFGRTIADIQRQLRELATKRNLRSASIEDSDHVTRVRIGFLPDGTVGVIVYDNAGNIRCRMGEIPPQVNPISETAIKDYGFMVVNSDGTYEEVLPEIGDFADTTVSTSSSSWVTKSGSPTVTATLGASGDAWVQLEAYIDEPGNTTGLVALTIDSTNVGEWLGFGCGSAAEASCSTRRRLSDLSLVQSAGEHAFGMQFTTSGSGGSVDFSAMGIIITPI